MRIPWTPEQQLAEWKYRKETSRNDGTTYPLITGVRTMETVFRYDLASLHEPRIILITDHVGKRSETPRLGYVVLPQPKNR